MERFGDIREERIRIHILEECQWVEQGRVTTLSLCNVDYFLEEWLGQGRDLWGCKEPGRKSRRDHSTPGEIRRRHAWAVDKSEERLEVRQLGVMTWRRSSLGNQAQHSQEVLLCRRIVLRSLSSRA
jgi:hypothetical protein